jgi:hypothetical protein
LKPNCAKCKHYFITWDAKCPRGCKLYQIKSKDMPSEIVRMAGSGDCQGFELKDSKEKNLDPYADRTNLGKQNQ